MSKIVKITNWYPSEKVEGNIVYEFIDDFNRVYSLEFSVSDISLFYEVDSELNKSERAEAEIWSWWKYKFSPDYIPSHVLRYMQASFMEWREVIEIQDAN